MTSPPSTPACKPSFVHAPSPPAPACTIRAAAWNRASCRAGEGTGAESNLFTPYNVLFEQAPKENGGGSNTLPGGRRRRVGGDGPKWIRNLPCNCGPLIDTRGKGGGAVKFPSNCIKDTLIRLIKNREAVSFFPQKA